MTALDEAGRDRLRARRIGYVFQTFNLLQGLSALENVMLAMALAGRADEARARALLERVGLGDRLADRPRQLSAGQQQRVAVARALANRPALVLADEPTGNLDPASAGACLALLRETCLESGAALLLVSHDPAVLGALPQRTALGSVNRAGGSEGAPA
jgi:putative ABC transport system ATP-binding protein